MGEKCLHNLIGNLKEKTERGGEKKKRHHEIVFSEFTDCFKKIVVIKDFFMNSP